MTSKKITTTLGNVQTSFESAWNRVVMGVRTKRMPKTIKRVKQSLNKGQHSTMPDHWERDRDADVLSSSVFYSKYLGSTLVEELVNPEPGANYYNTGLGSKALDRVIRMSRNKNMIDVSINISSGGIEVLRLPERISILEIPMDRVSFCTNDKKYCKVTAFMARNSINGTMECYAFLCHRQKLAKAIADTLLGAFKRSKESQSDLENRLSSEEVFGLQHPHTAQETTDCDTRRVDSRNDCVLHENGQDYPGNHERAQPHPHNNFVYEKNNASASNAAGESGTSMLIDDNIRHTTRARADSDSWAVMAAGGDDCNAEIELEFSNFARSRSTTNLNDLHTSVYSTWNI